MNDKELKKLIKDELGFSKGPRSLNAFYCFYVAYRAAIKKYYKDRVAQTISCTLTEFPDVIWYVSTSAFNKAGVNSRSAKKYFDSIVVDYYEFTDGTNYVARQQCRTIAETSANWIKLFKEIGMNLKIPKSFYDKYYFVYEEYTHLAGTNDKGYHGTAASPFRRYHWIQGLRKEERAEMFSDNYQSDIESCFGSIAYNMLDLKSEFTYLLAPENKSLFRQKICESYNCTMAEAKTKSQFIATNKTWTTKECDWLHELHCEINAQVYKQIEQGIEAISSTLTEIDTHHKFFTYHERQIIDLFEKKNKLQTRLFIHDCIISQNKPKSHTLEYAGKDYLFSIERL